MLQVGSLLDNKYKILSEVGHGGMSVVYLAINERANKTWAVKEIRKTGSVDFEAVKQGLIVETDMLKKLSHPNLPDIVDVIDTEDSFLIVMDYIQGSSLQKLLKTEGAQSEEKVVKWGKQLCDVLGYLHRQTPPIIYRDMKPANVMLKPDGNVTLIDFGTAREFKNRAMVEDTTCLGTRGYAAPEQFGGRGQTDARTDIYCLGATLYHLLTGHSPAEPPYEIKPLSYWIPGYAGSGLEKVLLKCTQQDPAARYQNCAELMYALEHYRDEDDIMRRKRRKQWAAFIAGLVIGTIGIAGMTGFRMAYNGAKSASYEYLIEQAEAEASLAEARTYYLQALNVNAADMHVYESLMRKTETDIIENGELTADASTIFSSCLTSTANGTSAYIDSLRSADPESYAKVLYEAGLWHFFMRGKPTTTDKTKISASDVYFSKIQDDRYLQTLEPAQQELAVLLYNIGSYIGSMDSKINKFGSSNSSTDYKTLYEDIGSLVSGDLKSKVEKDSYCIRIYQEAANWINSKYSDFTGAGVAVDELKDTLKTIENGLNNLNVTKESDNYEDYQVALSTLANANKTIERISR